MNSLIYVCVWGVGGGGEGPTFFVQGKHLTSSDKQKILKRKQERSSLQNYCLFITLKHVGGGGGEEGGGRKGSSTILEGMEGARLNNFKGCCSTPAPRVPNVSTRPPPQKKKGVPGM